MSKIQNGGLDQCGAEPFEQQQFRTSGIERVNCTVSLTDSTINPFNASLPDVPNWFSAILGVVPKRQFLRYVICEQLL